MSNRKESAPQFLKAMCDIQDVDNVGICERDVDVNVGDGEEMDKSKVGISGILEPLRAASKNTKSDPREVLFCLR